MMDRQAAENCHAYVAMHISAFRKNVQLSTVAHDMLRRCRWGSLATTCRRKTTQPLWQLDYM